MTEDDTFRALKRPDYHQLKAMLDAEVGLDSTMSLPGFEEILAKHGWTYKEYAQYWNAWEVNKVYNPNDGSGPLVI